MYKRILVAVDGSHTSNRALASAIQMARESGATLFVMHAFDDLAFLPGYEFNGDILRSAREGADRLVAEGQQKAAIAGVPVEARLIETHGRRLGDVVAEQVTSWGADLVVVGTHGRRGIDRVLLGSGAEQIIRIVPVPVLAVREGGGRGEAQTR